MASHPETAPLACELSGTVAVSGAESPDEGAVVSDIYQSDKDDVTEAQKDTGDEAAANHSLKRKADEVSKNSLEKEENIPKRSRRTSSPDNAKLLQLGSLRNTRPSVVPELPAEIWHHILKMVPPTTLGSLLSVNRLFRRYLDPSFGVGVATSSSTSSASSPSDSVPCILPPMKPDAIWQASRRLFWPRMPAPLKGRSEVEMWRICCSRACQFCRYHDSSSGRYATSSADHWHRGPGPDSVVPVFPFFITSCGRCLAEQSVKEIDAFLAASIPSVLLPGLSVVFLTPENHVIPPQVLYSGSSLVQDQIAKVFWQEQIDRIKVAFEAAIALGPAAAEEWIKGLDTQGKRLLADASRWEKWYLSGGVDEMRSAISKPGRHTTGCSTLPGASIVLDRASNDKELAATSKSLPANPKPPLESDDRTRTPPTMKAISEIQAVRRAEIERRASMLEPPITPTTLSQIPSFQTALQTDKPLDDQDWQLLAPRLLMQRSCVERLEKGLMGVTDAVPKAKSSTGLVKPLGPLKVSDAAWNDAQGPVRARLAQLADEVIRSSWSNGRCVKKKNASQFAAAVLLFVRKRFYDEIAKQNAVAKAAGRKLVVDPPGGPWTQKLTIENMKWTFDTKVRPHTDRIRKDIFLCDGCDNSKLYSLDAVVQHYAAKHTDALSMGNVVVHWRAEWPAFPIFAPYPKSKLNKTKQQPGDGKPAKGISNTLSKGQTADLTKTHPKADNYKAQLESMARISRRVWDTMAKADDLPDELKACVLLHHVSKGFETTWNKVASLNMFIDGLSNNREMRPIRSINRLKCKACVTCVSQSADKKRDKKYMITLLLDHFRAVHSEQSETSPSPPLDWRVDMVWLPGETELGDVRLRAGDDPDVLDAIRDALPWAFIAASRRMGPGLQERRLGSKGQQSENILPSHFTDRSPRWTASNATVQEDSHPSGPQKVKRHDSDVPHLEPARVVYNPAIARNKLLHGGSAPNGRAPDRQGRQSSASLEKDGFEIIGEGVRHHRGALAKSGVHHSKEQMQQQQANHFPDHSSSHGAHSYYREEYWDKNHDETTFIQPPLHLQQPARVSYNPNEPSFPVQPFEIVGVRDPRGDYLIKRPIVTRPPDAVDIYAHSHQYSMQPPYTFNDPVRNSHHPQHLGNSHPVDDMFVRYSRSDYEDYDPRYPAAANPRPTHERQYYYDHA